MNNEVLEFFLRNINIVVLYASIQSSRLYKINKDFKPNPEVKIKLPPKINCRISKKTQEKILNEEFSKHILNFNEIIEKNFSKENLNLYYKNINNFKFLESKFFLPVAFISRIGGTYNPKRDCVFIFKYDNSELKTIPYHELFHMASSIYNKDEKTFYCGFHQQTKEFAVYKRNIGMGLNEGYTQLITERYFNIEKAEQSISITYKILQGISFLLEKIIGKEDMESLYMNANLGKLIEKMSEYDSSESAIEFVRSLDFIRLYNKANHPVYKVINYLPGLNKKVELQLKNVEEKLINWYSKKELKSFNSEKIGFEELIKNINEFLDEMTEKLTINGNNYDLLTEEEKNGFMNKINAEINLQKKI